MSHSFQSVTTNEFRNLSLDRVIDPNFDTTEAFWRSIKVFLVSFAGYEDSNTQLFNTKFQEYVEVMKDLFDVPNVDMTHLVAIKQEVDVHNMELRVGILRVRGLDMCDNLRVYLRIGPELSDEMYLNMDSEIQDHMCDYPLNYRTLLKMKSFNIEIKYMAEADHWTNETEPLNQFSIRFREISAEGFEEWVQFGRGVEMLVKIEIIVAFEPNSDSDWISKFHLHALYRMLCKEYEKLKDSRLNDIHWKHKTTATKMKMNYIRKRINTSSEMSYWTVSRIITEFSDILQRVRDGLESGISFSQMTNIFDRNIKYIDLQIAMNFNDEYEDSVCLCSKWCHWNAFFHYNPIYRCLLVNHARLYMEDKTNVADMYLLCASALICLAESDKNADPNLVVPQTPIFRLINCANNYRNYNYQNYYLKLRGWSQRYRASTPPFEHIIGISYKILREQAIIPDLLIQSDVDPFSDNCLDNLINYYNVLGDLHTLVGQIDAYVPNREIRKWFKEYNRISRDYFCTYIVSAYNKKILSKTPTYDFLFSEDYEFSNVFTPTEDHKRIKTKREMIYKSGFPHNPLNMRVTLSPLLSSFASIYKVITKVEPLMPIPTTGPALETIFDGWNIFDDNFDQFVSTHPFTFFTELEEVTKDVIHLQTTKHYFVFYTLKLYLMSFAIQRQSIESLIKWNSHSSEDFRKQVCSEFKFIWSFEVIELKYRHLFQEQLYSDPEDISPFFTDFYETFWGWAAHETNPNPSVGDCFDSAFDEYHKLYFWVNNGGDTRLKFRAIIDTLDRIQTKINDRTEEIYLTYIMEAILSIEEYEHHIEVFDTLVYYLLSAYCSMILNTTALFFMECHDLQMDSLVTTNTSFTLTKTGLISLLKTMYKTFDKLEDIKKDFILFDDENNRIVNALDSTKSIVKDIYRQFYQKLMKEWLDELNQIYSQPASYIPWGHLGALHIASGLSFATAFINDFRLRGRKAIKLCWTFLTRTPNQGSDQQIFIHSCLPTCEAFVRDPTAIRDGQPFLSSMWINTLNPIFTQFNQNVGQLSLDISQADVHI